MSDDTPDLSRINPPVVVPTDKPDKQTAAETEAYKKTKSPSPTDRMVEEHKEHLSTYRDHINHYKEEYERCRQELAEVRIEWVTEREKSESLGRECVKLRELSWSVTWMMLVGNGMVAVGSISLGIAGCWPDLPNAAKYALGGGGAATAICGVVLTVLAFAAGKRARASTN